MKNDLRRPRSNTYDHAYERLRFVIRASGLHTGLFAREIGFADSEQLHAVLCGRAPMTRELARRIYSRSPQIDEQWLLNGPAGAEE